MKIKSKSLGEMHINPDTIINFPDGIPGFEDQTRFQLFQQTDSNIVYELHSLINKELIFSVAHPSDFNINYQFILTEEDENILKLDSTDDLLVLLLLHRDENPQSPPQPTIKGSIKSPLLINTVKRIGIQKLLQAVEQSITLTEQNNEIEVSEA
jgi:flagellar assembly factor FliW